MTLKRKELRGMSRAELELKRDELRQQLFDLNIKRSAQQLENSAALKYLRRDLAKVLTLVREDELGIRELPKEGAAKGAKVKTEKKAAAPPKKEVKK